MVKEPSYLDSCDPLFLIAVIVFIASLSLSACGTTRAVVHNGATGTSTEIRITTNNPTSVTASPNVELKHSNSID